MYLPTYLRTYLPISCFLKVYLNIDNSDAAMNDPDAKNSFLPVTAHFILILIEHVIIVIWVRELYPDFGGGFERDQTITFFWLPVLMWAFATITMWFYYQF